MKLGKLPIAWKSGSAMLNLWSGKVTKATQNVYILKHTPRTEKIIYSLPPGLKKEWKGGDRRGYFVGEPIVKYIRRLK
jgi:hypothetical protein